MYALSDVLMMMWRWRSTVHILAAGIWLQTDLRHSDYVHIIMKHNYSTAWWKHVRSAHLAHKVLGIFPCLREIYITIAEKNVLNAQTVLFFSFTCTEIYITTKYTVLHMYRVVTYTIIVVIKKKHIEVFLVICYSFISNINVQNGY